MTLYTVNVSKARGKGRNKRAKKAASLLREELERQEDEEVSLSNEVNQEIWKNGAARPPRKITVEVVDSDDGLWAVLSDKEQQNTQVSDEGQQQTGESDTGSDEVDYEGIVDGTVSEAKDAVEELDSPDYEALIQAEKDGKDRKTLIEFLEGKQ